MSGWGPSVEGLEFKIEADSTAFSEAMVEVEYALTSTAKRLKRDFLGFTGGDPGRRGQRSFTDALLFGADGSGGFKDRASRAVDSVGTKLLSVMARGGVVGLVADSAIDLGKAFVDAFIVTADQIEEVRKGLVITRKEMFGLSEEVAAAGLKYGFSLGRVQNILSALSHGTRFASKDLAELSQQLKLMNVAMGGDERKQAELAADLATRFELSADQVYRLQYALGETGKLGKVSIDQIADAIEPMMDDLQRVGRRLTEDERASLVGQLTSVLSVSKELQGDKGFRGVSAAIRQAFSGEGTLGAMMKQARFDVAEFLKLVQTEVRKYPATDPNAQEQLQKSLGIDQTTVRAFENVYDRYEDRYSSFLGAYARDAAKIREELAAQMGPLDKIRAEWGKIETSTGAVVRAIIEISDPFLKRVGVEMENIAKWGEKFAADIKSLAERWREAPPTNAEIAQGVAGAGAETFKGTRGLVAGLSAMSPSAWMERSLSEYAAGLAGLEAVPGVEQVPSGTTSVGVGLDLLQLVLRGAEMASNKIVEAIRQQTNELSEVPQPVTVTGPSLGGSKPMDRSMQDVYQGHR